MSDDEKVGYKNPPLHSRFKPGQSGNPNGRPKGSKNKRTDSYVTRLSDIVLNEALREIQVKENGETVTVEVAEAVTRALVASAMKGVAKSQKLFFELVEAASQHRDLKRDALLEAYVNFKERCYEAYKLADASGLPRPDIVPHPDDIIIDMQTGEVGIAGPLTYSERDREDLERIAGFKREVAYFDKRLKVAKKLKCKPATLKVYRDEVKYARDMLDKVTKLYEAGQKSVKPDWTFKAL